MPMLSRSTNKCQDKPAQFHQNPQYKHSHKCGRKRIFRTNCAGRMVNSFSYQCRMLVTFANSLDIDQTRQNFGSDLYLNCVALRWVFFLRFFPENVNLKKR